MHAKWVDVLQDSIGSGIPCSKIQFELCQQNFISKLPKDARNQIMKHLRSTEKPRELNSEYQAEKLKNSQMQGNQQIYQLKRLMRKKEQKK